MSASPSEITQLLLKWRNGDSRALDELMPRVYGELHRIARYYMAAEQPGQTLQTTALINEAYLRLIGYHETRWQDRAHFFAVAAQAMRRILVEHARARHAAKRGGDVSKVPLEEATLQAQEQAAELIALDAALTALAEIDPRKSQVVEMRYFGGLSVEETAGILGVSPVTIMRDWSTAKAWLLRAMTEGKAR